MKDLNLQCRDVRTREVGIQEIHNKIRPFEVYYNIIYYIKIMIVLSKLNRIKSKMKCLLND